MPLDDARGDQRPDQIGFGTPARAQQAGHAQAIHGRQDRLRRPVRGRAHDLKCLGRHGGLVMQGPTDPRDEMRRQVGEIATVSLRTLPPSRKLRRSRCVS